eukprot:8910726-Pyramimonas_sp.AAC.1
MPPARKARIPCFTHCTVFARMPSASSRVVASLCNTHVVLSCLSPLSTCSARSALAIDASPSEQDDLVEVSKACLWKERP